MFTRLSLVTGHATKIVSLQEIKDHLFISHSDEDTYLLSLASAVTAMIDGPDGIGVSLAPATYRLSLDRTGTVVELPMSPVTAIVSVTVDGTTVDDTKYRLEGDRTPARVYFDHDQISDDEDGVKITFTTGFSTIPSDLKQAALLLVGHFYRHREATTEFQLRDLPFAVNAILERYRS